MNIIYYYFLFVISINMVVKLQHLDLSALQLDLLHFVSIHLLSVSLSEFRSWAVCRIDMSLSYCKQRFHVILAVNVLSC